MGRTRNPGIGIFQSRNPGTGDNVTKTVIGLHLYEIPIELSSLMNLSVTMGLVIALNLTVLTTLKTKKNKLRS